MQLMPSEPRPEETSKINRKDYHTVVDYNSDFVEVSELEETTAPIIQVLVRKEHFSRQNVPDTVVSDNGPQFSNQEFHEI